MNNTDEWLKTCLNKKKLNQDKAAKICKIAKYYLRYYFCPHCLGTHLTSQKLTVPKEIVKKVEVKRDKVFDAPKYYTKYSELMGLFPEYHDKDLLVTDSINKINSVRDRVKIVGFTKHNVVGPKFRYVGECLCGRYLLIKKKTFNNMNAYLACDSCKIRKKNTKLNQEIKV